MTNIRGRTGMRRRPLTTVTVMMMWMMIVKMMVLRRLVHMSMKRKFLCHTVAVHGLTSVRFSCSYYLVKCRDIFSLCSRMCKIRLFSAAVRGRQNIIRGATVKNSSITTKHLYLILTFRSHHEILQDLLMRSKRQNKV